MNSKRRLTVCAVKLDHAGWLGVSVDAGRCSDHAHETPELAKLCALHREHRARPDCNVVLLPIAPPARAGARCVLGRSG